MFYILLLLPIITVFAHLFNQGELEAYNEYQHTSKFTDELNKVYQPALEKVTRLKDGDAIESERVKNILSGPDSTLSIVKYIYEGVDKFSKAPKDTERPEFIYDFIIIGAGSAGSVLANRLTEVSDVKVLLIEAGEDELFYMDLPSLVLNLQQSSVDWEYKTEPSDRYCTGMNDNQCRFPRGKVLGGSSTINYMFHTRGSSHDYDNWMDLGNEGWSFNDALKYFKKLETFNIPKRYDPEYHGYKGPVSVEHGPYRTITGVAFIQASQNKGFKYIEYNGKESCGVSWAQLSMTNGTRHSGNRAYIYPISHRKNLDVVKGSLATKLIFNKAGTTIIGVVFERRGLTYKVYTKREVIVSAGAINSPQLLMLSGIGPKEDLDVLGIPVKRDLPVGRNFMDHVAVPISFRMDPDPTQINPTSFAANLTSILDDFVKYHKGPLAFAGVEALILANLRENSSKAWPEIEITFRPSTLNSETYKKVYNIKNETFYELYSSLGNDPGFTVSIILLRPKSRGTLKLRSKDPRTHPILIPNYFDDEEDLKILVEGIKLAMKITESPALKNRGAKLYEVPLKSCLAAGPFKSDEYWKCFIRAITLTIFHYSGTCKMGPRDDFTAVVDPRLRVYDVQGLRVVDASIFPAIPAAHTNVPVYMTAEKASDMIKEDWGL